MISTKSEFESIPDSADWIIKSDIIFWLSSMVKMFELRLFGVRCNAIPTPLQPLTRKFCHDIGTVTFRQVVTSVEQLHQQQYR
jgi:hypothetical protein